MRSTWLHVLFWLTLLLAGCQELPTKVPGETDILVAKVSIEAEPGKGLALPHGDLFERLGMRPGSLLITPRHYSDFREAEDRRRIEAYWQQRGYFEVVVKEAEVSSDPESGKVSIRFQVTENERYEVGTVELDEPGRDPDPELAELATAKRGDAELDLEALRQVRITMQEQLRSRGYGHANVYSRFFIDRPKRQIHVRYFVDRGPETVIASVYIDGNVRVPSEDILARSGLVVGERYSEDLRETVVRELLDSGSFAAAYVRVDTDTKFIAPGTAPDSGGELRDEQIDAAGKLVTRKLPQGVNVTIHVVEASRVTLRVRAGIEADPARADTFVASRILFRDVFGPLGHLVVEGRFGYGWLYGTPSDDPSGPYGEASIRTEHAGALGRLVDLHTIARYRGDLFPSAYLHALSTGPGLHTAFARGLFLDVDLLAVWQRTEGYGPFTAAERDRLSLPSQTDAYGPELSAAFVWDSRNDPIEPMRGHLLSLVGRLLPGDPIATHRVLDVAPDARLFLPLTRSISLGGRAAAEWAMLEDEAGVPLGYRLFGGGSYGFRGFGRQLFSPTVARCMESYCTDIAVGGKSLLESSLELRFLPPRVQVGAVAFADFGGASPNENPFAEGVALAAGIGGRLRIWYLPLAIDVSYRILQKSEIQVLTDEPFHVFFRIGEAF